VSALTPADVERASSWHIVIAGILIPADIPFADENGARHWPELGLHIDLGTGAVHWPRAKVFGDRTVWFIRSLQRCGHQIQYSREQAEAWLETFLARPEHQGIGPLDPKLVEENETRRIANAERAAEILAEAVDIAGTDGERYLESRGLLAPWPLPLKWHPNMRPGEGAIIAPLTALGRVVSILITYITALATKSLVAPPRRRLNIEKHPGAYILIDDRLPGVFDIIADTIITEGVENGLALARVKRPGWRILALVGINTLQNIAPERSGERIIVFQDSDPEGSPARAGLQRGIDALKLVGANVKCTAFSELGDANDILRHQDGGEAELTRLLQTAAVAPLSFGAEVERLARLPPTEYEKARRRVAEEQGVRLSYLDRAVARLRPRPDDGDEETAGGGYVEPVDEPWDGPAPELSHILDSAAAVMPQFLVAPPTYYDVIALWSAASYLVQSEEIALPIMPQLAFQSAGPESGKSTALEITATLAFRGRLRSSYTASTVFRRIHEKQESLCLVDVHTLLVDPRSDLHQIVKACHRRAEAFVDRTEEDSGRGRYIKAFRCWAALAWASIGPLFEEMQGRAIVLPLRPALREESRALDHSSPGRCRTLIDCRRQFAAWAPTITTPLDPAIPEPLYSRIADNWRPLVAIAEMAGGDWPERVLAAIDELRRVEHRPSLMTRLLTAICEAFDDQARAQAGLANPHLTPEELLAVRASPDTRLAYDELLEALNNNEESGLDEANHGRRITLHWLRDHFRDLTIHSRDWWEGPKRARKHRSGYYRHQFDDTFARYRIPSPQPPSGSGAPGAPGAPSDIASVSAGYGAPDGAPDAEGPSGAPTAAKSAAESGGAPGAPGAPDAGKGSREDMPAAANGGDATDGPSPPESAKPQENGADREDRPGSPAGDPLLVNSILGYVELHPEASARKIASALGIKASTVERMLAEWRSPP
jgi:hypothetical protein